VVEIIYKRSETSVCPVFEATEDAMQNSFVLTVFLFGIGMLVSCGGSGNGQPSVNGVNAPAEAELLVTDTNAVTDESESSSVGVTNSSGSETDTTVADLSSRTAHFDASRFLGQTTFGPRLDDVTSLAQSNYNDWLQAQFALPVTSMREAFDREQQLNPDQAPSRDWLFETFWKQAVNSDDQLRQRVAFALSQIFVISLRDGGVASSPRGAGDFYSRLATHAFGNFRDGNEKGDANTGQVPDENFAREIMQLFTIGLYELNTDGTVITDESGEPIETYKTDDVIGLARVMTGFSWNGPDTELGRFQGWIPAPDRDIQLMQAYPQQHSILEKRFLDSVIPASDVSDPVGDLQIALDALFNHSNVGPFIGKQLIQRLVSSNPSDAYVQRVASVFADNGQGVRGDMKAVVTAIVMDPEARGSSHSSTSGRIREPILRLAHWMRSFNATSVSGRFKILGTDDPATNLGMTVLRSPSVFNYYRPGYVPPATPIADAGLVSPEMQITHETSVAGYLNSMLATVMVGGGFNFDIRSEFPYAVTLADDPQVLVDHMDLLLTHGTMSDALRQQITNAVSLVPAAQDAGLTRARIACYLTMASPEYLVQK